MTIKEQTSPIQASSDALLRDHLAAIKCIEALEAALIDAAMSLEAIARSDAEDMLLERQQIRGYARNRAIVARAALPALTPQEPTMSKQNLDSSGPQQTASPAPSVLASVAEPGRVGPVTQTLTALLDMCDSLEAERDSLRAQVQTLRDALNKIAGPWAGYSDDQIKAIARAALARLPS